MAAALPKPIFAPRLDRAQPPSVPPRKNSFGDYCFKATAKLLVPEVPGWFAVVRGYDTTPEIAKRVESACRTHAHKYGTTAECTEAALLMLKSSKLQCDGEIYFETNSDIIA
jgi:hypothetical protein